MIFNGAKDTLASPVQSTLTQSAGLTSNLSRCLALEIFGTEKMLEKETIV